MPLTIDQLVTPVTEDQALETFLSELETLGLAARSWRKGGVARSILRVVAKTYSGFTQLMAAAIKSGFLETAEGDWLTLLAKYVYGVDRAEATFATGSITLVNAGGGIYSFNAQEVRFLRTVSGKTYAYVNVAAFTLNAGETKTISIQAVEVGSASSAAPGEINALETVLPLVTVSNADSVVGSDAETDAELREACKNKLGALSLRGPRGAYAYAVREATRPDGSAVDINRLSVSPSSSTGVVTVYLASPSGTPSVADIGYVATSIENIARPDSVTANTVAATAVPFTRTLTVWAKRTDGVSADDIKTLVNAAIVTEVAAYPIGGIPKPPSTQGYLYADFIAGVAKGAHPSIFDVDGTGADLALNPGEVATLSGLTITVSLVEVT